MRIIATIITSIILCSTQFSFAQKAKDVQAIRDIMQSQQDAWNSGDLDAFMDGYWESDSLKFIGGSGVTYGWQATLDRYKKGYPDKSAMGKLTFDILHIEDLGKKHMMVTGKWHLQREKDAPNGHYLLVWKKLKSEWVIIADHSS